MPVDPQLAGRTFPPTAPYDVSRSQIAAFAEAIGAPPSDEAPPTFPIVVAFQAMTGLMHDPEVGIELRNVVHADQRFVSARSVRAGDVLVAQLTIDTIRNMGGNDIISTRSEVTTVDGEQVCTAYATLAHRGPEVAA